MLTTRGVEVGGLSLGRQPYAAIDFPHSCLMPGSSLLFFSPLLIVMSIKMNLRGYKRRAHNNAL